MSSPKQKVAIVGRPNVGKSTFFNLLTETRRAVVKNEPGVTRDIQYGEAEVWGQPFEVLDTGGLTDAGDQFSVMIQKQVRNIISSVDLLLLIMDGKAGLCPEDRDMVRFAKESGKDFLLIVNKVDSAVNADVLKSEFYEFGVDVADASFEQRRGLAEVFEWIYERLDHDVEEEVKGTGVALAVVGKPNVGKSSLCNFLLGDERLLVSDTAGTTVDAIDSELVYGGRKYVLTDTAGLRRSSKRDEGVEEISAFKSFDSIDRSDVVLLMIDGVDGPSDQDAKILEYTLEQHKGVILVVNKMDLGKEKIPEFRKTLRAKISQEFHFFTDIPIAFISAHTGAGVEKLFELVAEVADKLHKRISTSELNDFFVQVIRQAPAPVHNTRNVKFYYLTQTKQVPPSFIAFVNYPQAVTPAYRRFLAKRIQERWDLKGIPIRIFAMKKRRNS